MRAALQPTPPGPDRAAGHGLSIMVFQGFAAAEATWREFERHGTYFPFQTFDWLSAWYRVATDASRLKLQLVDVRSATHGPLLFLPLAIERGPLARALVWLGDTLSDYNAPLIGRAYPSAIGPGGFAGVWRRIERALGPFDVIRFDRQPAVVGEIANPLLELGGRRRRESAHAARLEGDWEDVYRAKCGSRTRSTDRRKRRRLGDLGAVTFVVAGSPDEAEALVAAMIEQKRRRYHATGVRDPLAAPGRQAFYREMARRHGQDGLAHISALLADGEVVAAHFGVVRDRRFYYLMPSYDERLRHLSPGRLHLLHLLEWSVAQGLGIFDFTIGDEAYKGDWCDLELPLHDLLRARSLRGLLYSLPAGAGAYLKQQPRARALVIALRRRWRGARAVAPLSAGAPGGER